MVRQPKLTLPCTVRAIKHDKTKNTGEGVVDRTAPGIRVAVLPHGCTKMTFWGIFTAANVHPFMVVGTLLQMFILSFHYYSTDVYIDVMFGRVRIIYIFGMEPLVDSDRKGSYLIRQVFLHLCVTIYL